MSGIASDATGPPPDSDRPPAEDLVPLAEAARRLGIGYDAARKRLASGALRGERRGRQVLVWLPRPAPAPVASGAEPERSGTVPEPDRTPPEPTGGAPDALVAHLEAEVAFLRDELTAARRDLAAERERFDVLHREALGRIPPALPAGEPTMPPDPARDRDRLAVLVAGTLLLGLTLLVGSATQAIAVGTVVGAAMAIVAIAAARTPRPRRPGRPWWRRLLGLP